MGEALLRSGTDRDRFVSEACAGDGDLLAEVTSLLREIDEDPDFLETPVGRVSDAASWVPLETERAYIGQYRIVRPLGRGGMGLVLLAVRDEPRQYVAIKLVRRGLDTDDILRRFHTERRILAALSHPNIATLLDVGADEQGRPFIVMEYVDGIPIDEYCDSLRLSIRERIRLFQVVCSAVQYAHQSLVLHRDIKPGNILVTREGVPKLLDFGIGKVLESSDEEGLTQVDSRLFTPEYAAPEVLRDQPVTTTTDVYQLGVLLYELLSGHRPHQLRGTDRDSLRRSILEAEPERPSATVGGSGSRADSPEGPDPATLAEMRRTDVKGLRRALEGDLDTIVVKAIRSEPAERYPAAVGLSEDLQRYLDGQPVLARPAAFGYRAWKFIARNRMGVAAAAVAFISLALTTAVTLVQSRRVREESVRLARERDKALQVKGFLLETLGNTGPDVPAGDSATARQLLDLRASTLEQEFGDNPEMEAEFLDVLAQGYDNLSLYEDAEKYAREALRIREELFAPGEPNADLATSLNTLGWILHQRGAQDEAEPLLRRALEMRRVLFPDGHEELARSLNDLGVVREARGDYAEAESSYRESLAVRVPLVGERHRGVAVTLSNLSVVLYRRGSVDEAIVMARRALETFRAVLGADHRRTLIAQSNLAAMLAASGNLKEAISLHRDVLERRRRLLGPDHIQVAVSLGLLAATVAQNHQMEEADTLLREQIRIERTWFGEPNASVSGALNNLGSVQIQEHRVDEAIVTLRQALRMRRDELHIVDRITGKTTSNLGRAYLLKGDTATANRTMNEAVSAFRTAVGGKDPDTLREEIALAEMLWARGDGAAAEAIVKRARADLNGEPAPSSSETRLVALEEQLGSGG